MKFCIKEGVGRLIQARLIVPNVVEDGAGMKMAYRKRWEAEIAEMRRVLAGFEVLVSQCVGWKLS